MQWNDEHTLIEFCKLTINKDNVNRIPAYWDHILLAKHRVTLDECKEHGYGFLPLMIMCTHDHGLLTCWFLTNWKHAVDLDAKFPYTRYRIKMLAPNSTILLSNATCSSLFYAIQWNPPFAHFLLLSGATPSIESFRYLCSPYHNESPNQAVALFHFDRGLVPFNDNYPHPWIQEKCREYQTRRAYCRRTLIKLGGILRRRSHAREPGWDRHLVQYLMRYVWATRWREAWNQ